MHQCTLLALAFGLAVAIGPALSCERHQSHANLTTASTEPAPLPPQPVAKPALSVQPVAAISTKPVPSMTNRFASPFFDCPHMRGKEQTVYLTD
jgi:hypothetical protein